MSNCSNCPSKGSCNNKEHCSIENNPQNHIGKIIGIMSGKGGVCKSTITALTANQLAKQGYSVGILDADITGPSIPRLMGVKDAKALSDGESIFPVVNGNGIKVMSINLMMDDENELENQSIDIPIWKRYLLSVTEAAQFYHIGEKRLRQIVDIHPNGEFYLLVGNKVLFKKEQFEQFLAESTAI